MVIGLLPATAAAEEGGGPAAAEAAAATDRERQEAPLLTVEEDRVVGIDMKTSFDPMAIRQKLPPGYAVTKGTYRSEDGELPTINVLRNDEPILSVYPDRYGRIGLIQVLNPKVAVGDGRIGSPFETFFPEPEEADCVRGMEELSDTAICSLPDSRRINLLFDGSAWDGPDDVLPPPDQLRDWPLKYVIWSAEPRPEPDPDGTAD